MAKQILCPDCGSSETEIAKLEDNQPGGSSFTYISVVCECGYEYGVELEVATILD